LQKGRKRNQVYIKLSRFPSADNEKKKESFKDKKRTNGGASSFSDELKMPLVWIDLEMTGYLILSNSKFLLR
jgi:hypothetical protein